MLDGISRIKNTSPIVVLILEMILSSIHVAQK